MAVHVLLLRPYPLSTLTAAVALFDIGLLTARLPRVSRCIHTVLERDLFDLTPRYRTLLKSDPVDALVRRAFLEHGYPLAETSHIEAIAQDKWMITSGSSQIVVRLADDRLPVSMVKSPSLSHAALRASTFLDRCRYDYPRRLRDAAFMWAATFRKRCLDRPRSLMVNLGGGKWYEKGWKILDHSGSWYRYPKWFVDYPFDLTSMQPLPFADNSVRLLYCEHVFEHFPDETCAHICREVYRSLMPGGGFRVVLPDADLLYDKYRTLDQTFFAPWMRRYNTTLTGAFAILFAYPRTPVDEDELRTNFRTLSKDDFYNAYTRGLSYDYAKAGEHINWFNEEKLTAMLRGSGFSSFCRTEPQDSRFHEISGKNFDTRPSYSLHIDAAK